LLPKDSLIPASVVSTHSADRIDLLVTSDQVARQEWAESAAPIPEDQLDQGLASGTINVAPATSPLDEFDTVHVPVIEEQLEPVKRTVERGAVHVTTSVSEREETLSVPVIEEQVHIQRVAVDRLATATDLVRFGETMDVPIYGEDVDVTTRARVVEEVVIAKEGIEEAIEVSGTVLRHDIEVVDRTTTDALIVSEPRPRLRPTD
jgi:uncharacterized protein (TIGR02271 family)